MEGWMEVFLWLLMAKFLVFVNCTVCKENCHEIWTNGSPGKATIFSNYRRNKPDDSMYIINWQWSHYSEGKWSLYYKEWPQKAMQTGGFVLTIKKKQTSKLDWRVYNGVLIWTSVNRKPYEYYWNATVCNSNLTMKFESTLKGWQFHLGKVLLIGNKSGIIQLNGTTLTTSVEERIAFKRKRREIDDLSDEQKKTVWNKIRGYFRELFDQGDDDQRSWLKRIGDWLLGFMQRVLS